MRPFRLGERVPLYKPEAFLIRLISLARYDDFACRLPFPFHERHNTRQLSLLMLSFFQVISFHFHDASPPVLEAHAGDDFAAWRHAASAPRPYRCFGSPTF